jgi:hypothetical protein
MISGNPVSNLHTRNICEWVQPHPFFCCHFGEKLLDLVDAFNTILLMYNSVIIGEISKIGKSQNRRLPPGIFSQYYFFCVEVFLPNSNSYKGADMEVRSQ